MKWEAMRRKNVSTFAMAKVVYQFTKLIADYLVEDVLKQCTFSLLGVKQLHYDLVSLIQLLKHETKNDLEIEKTFARVEAILVFMGGGEKEVQFNYSVHLEEEEKRFYLSKVVVG